MLPVRLIFAYFFAQLVLLEIGAIDLVEVAITKLLHELTRTYFIAYPCIVFISDKRETLNQITVSEVPVMHIVLGETLGNVTLSVEESDTLDTFALQENAQAFERLLQKTLDAGCQGYIIQVVNVKAILYSFTRTVKRALQRLPRKFVYLPSATTSDMDLFAEKLLEMKDLEHMPDMVIAKIHQNVLTSDLHQDVKYLRNIQCTDIDLQLKGSNLRESLRRKLLKNFKQNQTKQKSYNLRYVKWSNLKESCNANTQSTEQDSVAIELVTHSYVGYKPSEELFLDIWVQFMCDGYFILCANLYPNKIADLQGKPIYASTIEYDPFIILDLDAVPPVYSGFELLMFKELVHKLNGSTKFILETEDKWGAIYDNGTSVGIFGSVLNGEGDCGFAALYMDWYHEWVWTDFSLPYGQSAGILVVPRPRLLPGFLIALLPFSTRMWVAICASLIFIAFIIYSLSAAQHKLLPGLNRKRMNFNRSFLDTLAMLVLQVPNDGIEEAIHSPWKHLMTWLFIYFVLITAIYSGGLAAILTLPLYEPAIETLVDMANSDKTWTFNHGSTLWAFRYTEDEIFKTLAKKFHVHTTEELMTIALHGDTCIFIEMLVDGVFSVGPYITEEAMARLRLMKEPLYLEHLVLIVKKGSPYIYPLNKMILLMNQAGIALYWQAEVVRQFLSSRLQVLIALSGNIEHSEGNTPRTLQLTHVESPFMILAVGFAIATVAFIMEFAAKYVNKKQAQNSK